MTCFRRLWALTQQNLLLVGSATIQSEGPFRERLTGDTVRSRARKELLRLQCDARFREPSLLRGQFDAVARSVSRRTKFSSTQSRPHLTRDKNETALLGKMQPVAKVESEGRLPSRNGRRELLAELCMLWSEHCDQTSREFEQSRSTDVSLDFCFDLSALRGMKAGHDSGM